MRAYLTDLAAKSAKMGTLGVTEPHVSSRQIAMLYGIALAAVAVALAVRLALVTTLGDESPYLSFVPAVLIAAGSAGLGPGLFAMPWQTRLWARPQFDASI
jgi:hypothetical protein